MTEGLVLIADDEATFSRSLARVLENNGIAARCVPDAAAAEQALQNEVFDAACLDINMPGNRELEFVRQLSSLAPSLPTIVITGYPSVETAVESVQLLVFAYLVKPVDFDQLLQHLKRAISFSTLRRVLSASTSHLMQWAQDAHRTMSALESSKATSTDELLAEYVGGTVHHITNCLHDLHTVVNALTAQNPDRVTSLLLNPPLLEQHREILRQTARVLEHTKASFKSREIGLLRSRIEEFLQQTSGPLGTQASPETAR